MLVNIVKFLTKMSVELKTQRGPQYNSNKFRKQPIDKPCYDDK